MKNSLSKKFILFISSIMILSFIIFTILISTTFVKKYKEINNARLIQFVTQTENLWTNGKMEETGFEYIIGNSLNQEFETSKNINNLIDQKFIKQIISDYKSSSYKISPIVKEYKSEKIYTCGYLQNGRYIIAITDNTYIVNQTFNIVIKTALIYFIIILIADLGIFYYSRILIKRINGIKDEIISLPNNKYKVAISNYGSDELSYISQGVEDLRLNILNEELKRQEMFQNLSHDLKTPISVIKSYAEAIKDGIEDINAIDIILNQTNILEIKAKKLLELNKIEYINNDLLDVEISDVIKDCISVIKTEKNIILDLENVLFKGFYDNYRVVIENLLENAIRYAKTKIEIKLRNDYLSIYNDGQLIDNDILDTLFLPYVKGSNGNFGVGLSIVKRTLDVFGYSITASNLDDGVIFEIRRKEK